MVPELAAAAGRCLLDMTPLAHHTTPAPIQGVPSLPPGLIHQVDKSGYLESAGVGVALLALAGLVVAAWAGTAVVRRRRGHRLAPRVPGWLVHTGASLSFVLLLLAGAAVLVNSYVGYIPTLHALFVPPGRALQETPSIHDIRGSQVVRLDLPAPNDGVRTGLAYVYLPPGYDQPRNAHRRYPTVYLLHGTPGRPQDWVTAGGLQRTMDLLIRHRLVGPMIVVSPTTSTGYLNDDECLDVPGRFMLDRYLAVDLVDDIGRIFRTAPTRWERAIGGMSSGAYCALNVGLQHLHRFSVILASEPYGDPGYRAWHHLMHNDWTPYRANSPSFYLPLMHFPESVSVFLDAPSRDPRTTRNSRLLAGELARDGQTVAYRVATGQHHTWREAREELPYALVFAWRHFRDRPATGSDRQDAEQVAAILRYAATLPPPALPPGSIPPLPSRRPATTPTAAATR